MGENHFEMMARYEIVKYFMRDQGAEGISKGLCT